MESQSRFGLVRRSPAFGLLFLATAGSGFGTYLAAIALTVHIEELTGSGTWVAALLIADFLPIVLIGLLLGPLVDRLSRRWLMIASDLVRFGVFGALWFVESPTAIVALAGVAGIATGFFRPAVYAGVPNLVPDEELTNANSLLQTVETIAWMVGPIVSGLMLTVWEPRVPYAVNAVTFLVSAALVAGIPRRKLQSEESLTRGHWRDVADGIRLVVTSPPLRTVLVVWNVILLGSAAVNVAEIFFAKDEDMLDAGNPGFGALVAGSGVGLALGAYLAAPALGKVGLRRHYIGAMVLMGLGWGGASLATTIWVAVPFVIAGAAGNGAAIICNQLLVQRGATDRYRGRALATIMSSNYALLGLAMAAAGVLTNEFGARVVWMGASCIFLFGAFVAFLMTSWLPVRSRDEDRIIESYAEAGARALAGSEPEPALQPAAVVAEPVVAPEPVTAPEPRQAPEPRRAPEPRPATEPALNSRARRDGGRGAKSGLERIATLLEEIEQRRAKEARRRAARPTWHD